MPDLGIVLSLQQGGVPTLQGKTLDGTPFSVAAWHGKPIILNFWASWCAPCRDELPALQKLHQAGVQVVGVNVGEPPVLAATFAAAYGVTFPNLSDADYYWLRVFRVRTLPTTFFIAADGRVREVVNGGMSAAELAAKAAELAKR